MSYFDVPIGRCEAMRIMVMTDQTEQECTLDNGCPAGRFCSLVNCLIPAMPAEGESCSALEPSLSA